MTTTRLTSSSSSSLNAPLSGVNSQDVLSDQDDLPTLTDLSVSAPPTLMPPLPSIPARPTKTISELSLKKLCGASQTVMVYGKEHCLYQEVGDAASHHMKRVYNYRLGDDTNFLATVRETRRFGPDGTRIYQVSPGLLRLDGTRIYQVASGLSSKNDVNASNKDRSWGCVSKAALTNIVIENFRCENSGRPITPIIFCIDVVGGVNIDPSTSEKILAKGKKFTTFQEIRRAWKLANDSRIHPGIRAVTGRTIKFVKVGQVFTTTADYRIYTEYHLTEIPPPWHPLAHPEFAVHLRARQAISARTPKPPKEPSWRAQVNEQAALIRGSAGESTSRHDHTGRRLESAGSGQQLESDAGSQIDDGIKTPPARRCVLL